MSGSEPSIDKAALTRALKEKFQLSLLNEETFEVRRGQYELIELVLASDESFAISAFTSAGKSIVAIVKALQRVELGERVVITTITQHLVPQYVEFLLKLSALPAEEILALSGDESTSSAQREAQYLKHPKIIVATREIVRNDIDSGIFSWDGIHLFVFDECHHATGNDTYTELMPMVRDRGEIQIVALSATVGNDRISIRSLLRLLGTEKLFHLERERELIVENTYFVNLDNQLQWATGIIRGEILRCQRSITDELNVEQLTLFDTAAPTSTTQEQAIPSFSSREKLLREVQVLYKEDEERGGSLLSLWAEMGVYCHFYELLVLLGRFAFIDDFASRYGEHRIEPRGTLARVFRDRIKKRSSKRWFETRVALNRRIWQVFEKLSEETPYHALVKNSRWTAVWQEAFDEAPPQCEPQQLVDEFFERAALVMSERSGWESPKNQPLLEILHRHPQQLEDGRVIVFGWTRRHAQFLQAWLSHRLQRVGFRAGAVVGGPKSARGKRAVYETLDDFKAGKVNVLVSTEKIREGTDVAKAHVCVEYAIPDTNPRRRVQGMGRIGRDHNATVAYLYHILVRQGPEPQRFIVGKARVKRMSNALRAVATGTIDPTKGG